MIITILRHGEAGAARTDVERELTPRGIDDISFGSHQFLASCAQRRLPPPGLVLHSAWLRTTETADILANLVPEAQIRPEPSLLPSAEVSQVTRTLSSLQQQYTDSLHAVLVSHQPLVSELANFYLGYPNSVPGLPPGGLVTFSMEVPARDCATLLFWSLPPEYEAGI